MAPIQCRPEVNALTTPQSYRLLFVPRNSAGTSDLAARMAAALPNYSAEEFRTFLATRIQIIQSSLINGEQVTEDNAFSYGLSFTGRLDDPNGPLPDVDECLHVRVRVLPAFVAAVRQAAQLERLPMDERRPLLTTAADTLLELKDVLNPDGALQLIGTDLYFDRKQEGAGECVIEGTQSGRVVQSRFIKLEDSEIIVMPDIPEQAQPWNNEYKVTVSTRYSEHGTLRSGTYSHMLRTPLTVSGFEDETGILTGKESSPHVSITDGSASEDETLRIQAVFDVHADALLFSLLDMHEGGKTGTAVSVTADGEFTLQGFADSAVSSLSIEVNNYAALKEMIRSSYGGRLVDVLKVETA
jgi:hypothetical protein